MDWRPEAERQVSKIDVGIGIPEHMDIAVWGAHDT